MSSSEKAFSLPNRQLSRLPPVPAGQLQRRIRLGWNNNFRSLEIERRKKSARESFPIAFQPELVYAFHGKKVS